MDNDQRMVHEVKNNLVVLKIIFFALLFGQLAFAAVVYFLLALPEVNLKSAETFQLIVPAVMLGSILGGYIVSRKMITAVSKERSFIERLKAYRVAALIFYAAIEGPVLFAIIAYLFSSSILFILLVIAGILVFLLQYPSANKVAKDLGLSDEEKRMIS